MIQINIIFNNLSLMKVDLIFESNIFVSIKNYG